MASKLCDSCKSSTATLFCRPDSAFLCLPCDSAIHAANKLASRHPRLPLCDVCEQAPAHVTCKADAASLCVTCDHDIHSANPLARRHHRIPITPFYHSPDSNAIKPSHSHQRYLSEAAADVSTEEEEAEAASWLLKAPDLNSGQHTYPEIDPVTYSDLDFGSGEMKLEPREQNSSGIADGVVPVQSQGRANTEQNYDADKHFAYAYNASHSVSSSSMEVGVVPEGNVMSEISTATLQISAAEREARVLRYREKRKNRRFEKTIRYASRKAYAETRPRIKGRFAKRTQVDVDVHADEDPFAGYGVVPTC